MSISNTEPAWGQFAGLLNIGDRLNLGFGWLDDGDIEVVRLVDGAPGLPIGPSEYTVEIVDTELTQAELVLNVEIPAGEQWHWRRVTPAVQEQSFEPQGKLPAAAFEHALDRQVVTLDDQFRWLHDAGFTPNP